MYQHETTAQGARTIAAHGSRPRWLKLLFLFITSIIVMIGHDSGLSSSYIRR